ncbi:MAG: F0F1 ATP synthase subunit gamma [Lewinellaceae bacterium]|nr:F0F1 ATP synthase subunit gamma [Saprospiraceae bacterium]MCB9340411.1 F0F1 ATP synthase subunit gamma [Lewinellaceae bacterium]
MKDTLESLRHKIERATELGAVVRSMKALSASSIHQYELAAKSLEDYYRTVQLGLHVCAPQLKDLIRPSPGKKEKTGAIVFGSGQGLVGQFNDVLVHFAKGKLDEIPGKKNVWAIGETIRSRLEDAGLPPVSQFVVPHTVHAITPLIGQVLLEVERALESGEVSTVYLFFNRPRQGAVYGPWSLRFIPLDEIWLDKISQQKWQTNKVPGVVFSTGLTVKSLVQEYFFVTLFRACAESLASENASRLAAMQRAEKNIKELLENLNLTYHQLRQNSIDEELFDVIAGAEAMGK